MVKRGLKKLELKAYKERLLQMRGRLRGDVTTMAENALREAKSDLSSMPLHMADIGSENFEQEFTLSLLANEGDTLNMIEAALERIEDGDYGLCEECETLIPKARLNALPHTPFCVKCAEKLQR
jgi:DnaK suppressor protein